MPNDLNPLLQQSALPAFSKIAPAHVEPAIDQMLADCRQQVQAVLEQGQSPTWHNLVEPIEIVENRLNRAWSPISHLNAVQNSDELRAAYNACLPKLSDYGTEMGQNQALYQAYRQVAEKDQSLNAEQRKALDNALRDFRLSGVALDGEAKARFKQNSAELSQLNAQFDEHLLDATQAWTKCIQDVSALSGLPESALQLAEQTAQQRDCQGWLLTLDYPSYMPVMTYAEDRALRQEMYWAYATRASDQGPHAGKFDNTQVMQRVLELRLEQAKLLGFANYAERSLAKKMAHSTQTVLEFLNDLAAKSRPQALADLAELKAFASEQGLADLQPWDIAYYSEKLRQQRYQITQEELRPYFPVDQVLNGLFDLASRLFGIRIQLAEPQPELWHADARFYQILDASGDPLGQFYLDLYARQKKRGGAWMDSCVDRMATASSTQLPVAYLVCNFSPPVAGRPALLTHDEVQTLFHEFGHGLQHMLTRVDVVAVSGINGVPWDAVELPSQIMENWCWDKESLALISGHFETHEPLPEPLLERLLAARNFQSAMGMVRQLEFSLFDFRLHMEFDPSIPGQILSILNDVRQQVSVVEVPSWHRFAHAFGHIFSGGYAAGYYSYKWAEVLSADAFSLFEEKGVFDAATGASFRQHILEPGGSVDAMEAFIAFRGRAPQVDALLRHNGIA